MTKQTRYINDVVERFGQQAAKPVDNPYTSGIPTTMAQSPETHWRVAIRVLRYLNTTRAYGIIYRKNNGDIKVVAYSDADWGTNIDDRRSVPGVTVMLGNAPVVFKSKF
ncbi:unnamed protein product [Phytophthora fragariaefolia]|uniref:Unnamed protein product n=1 Tax=Phytophthora fragariaefolia TaxID=1490495 RepID=A0A9W7CVD9_9STRA|nr:unnamed protein product [Phytophthora fragariaefolia]